MIMSRLFCTGTVAAVAVLAANAVCLAAERAAIVRLQDGPAMALASPNNDAAAALASADFDSDGVADLITGSRTADGGTVAIFRGNVDALYPNSPEAKARRQTGEFTKQPFLSGRVVTTLPAAAEFVAAGDFDADGHWDILAAARGGTALHWLRGDGRGNFGEPQAIAVAGAITALVSGEANRVDGLADLAVGIATADGARVLVFEGAEGALRRAPESFAAPAVVTDLAFGNAGAPFTHDLAVASGSEVLVIHGRDRKLSLDDAAQADVAPAQVSRTAYATAVQSVAFGDFVGDEGSELAVLTTGGELHVHGSILRTGVDGAGRLTRAKVSALQKDDLVVYGRGSAVQIVTADAAPDSAETRPAQLSVAASVATSGALAAVLPMRLNSDAFHDLVVAREGGPSEVIESHGGATFVVNTTARTRDAVRGNGICADETGACSFGAAIEEANAHAGADTIHFNIPGGGVPTVSTHIPGIVLNELHEAVTIDGTTQPGGRVEINSDGFVPLIFYGGNSVLRGVAIYGQGASLIVASANNIIEGNYVGFRANGSKPSYSGIGGIQFRGGINSSRPGNNNLVGGTTAQARNVISNADAALTFPTTTGNVVQGNWVGLTIDGTAALPNGVSMNAFESPVTVGGTAAGAGNVFGGATSQGTFGVGLNINKAALIQGNRIGTTADGMQALPMRGRGIDIFTNEAVTVGGTSPAARNVIAACFWGIQIHHDNGGATVIQGNYIGTDAAGAAALPNSEVGLMMSGTRAAVIGGTASGAGNLISGNAKNGIELNGGINGTPNRGVVFQGNRIGTDAAGVNAIPNGGDGMFIGPTSNLLVGGTSAGAGNVISGNSGDGIEVSFMPPPAANRIEGNLIGLNAAGTGALGNAKHGIYLTNVMDLTIGGDAAGAGNRIAFNGGAGIGSPGGSDPFLGCRILSNSIFGNRGLGLDRGEDGPTPYRNTNAQSPVITSVTSSAEGTVISGNLRTYTFGPKGPFRIQFFSNTSPDPTGYGEGQTYIGETTITAGQSVAVPFSFTANPPVPAGRYITAVTIGQTDTQNNSGFIYTSEFSFNVRAPGDPRNNPLRIFGLSPAVAGNLGDATITLHGEGIARDATVVLRRSGMPDIVSQSLIVSSGGDGLQATFALAGQSLGQFDVVVTNPDGTSFVLPGSFQIVQGVAAEVWADVLGRGNARPGQPQTYEIVFGNRANTDAWGVQLNVEMPPGTTFKILSPTGLVTLDHIDPNHEAYDAGEDISQYDSFLDFDDARVVLFLVPVIPANTTGSILIQMTFPDTGDEGTVKAIIGEPMLESTAVSSPASYATRGNDLSPAATPPPSAVDKVRHLAPRIRKELGDRHIKPNGDIDIAFFEKQKADALRAFEESPSNETRRALNKADAQLLLALEAQGAISTAKGAKEVVDAKDKVVGGPVGWLKDKVQGWVLDKAFKSLKNIGSVPEIAKDFYKTMRDAIKRNTPKPIIKIIKWVRSLDPNDKAGSPGAGAQHFITGQRPIPYSIFFENKPTATAAAQTVVIIDQLDTAKLDLTTFQLGSISFGESTVVTPPPNLTEWVTDVDLRPENNLIVRISAALDKSTGIVTWRFTSIDPATNQPTDDPLAGFLPPDKVPPKGQGAVSFVISPKPNQPEGTEIRNKARIFFDLNAPIDTPEWLNTIDATPPTSEVTALPATNAAPRFEVQWSGSDGAAGVAFYTIYVSENGGEFTPWLVNTTETRAVFEGQPSSTYVFYSVATDGAGNREAAPLSGDTSTTTLAGQLLNIATRMRVLTGENVLIGGLIVTGTEPKRVILRAIGPSLSQAFDGALGDPVLELYQGDTLIARNDNWRDSQQAEIEATTIPPTHELESAIVQTLAPGFYTAVLSGRDDAIGIAVVESYDLAPDGSSRLANISSRGFVDTGDNVLIGGLIVGGQGGADTRVLIRAIGPSLGSAGITNALQDPTLDLVDANGNVLRTNDDWQQTQQGDIEATGVPPTHMAEAAIVATLLPGSYTAVVRGNNGTTGVGLVEVYKVN
jgi:hypothetical protein